MVSVEQQKIFDTVVDTIYKSGMNDYILVVGSWAEYLYEKNNILDPSYTSTMKTRDIDLLVKNKNVPRQKTSFFENMTQSGFEIETSRITGINKFINKESGMEVEFLLHEIGQGQSEGYKLESLGIRAIGLRHLNIIRNSSITTEYNGVKLLLPSPEAYALHKLVINSARSEEKKAKDLYAVQNILDYVTTNAKRCQTFNDIKSTLTKKELKSMQETIETHRWLKEAISTISEKAIKKPSSEIDFNKIKKNVCINKGSTKNIREARTGIQYNGRIINITEKHVLQSVGKQNVIIHDITCFEEKPSVGEDLSIRHTKQKTIVRRNERDRGFSR